MDILTGVALPKSYRSIGFLFLGKCWGGVTEPEDYFDFQLIRWSKVQLMGDLRAGNLPEGLIVVLPNYNQEVVVFDKLSRCYRLRPLTDLLNEVSVLPEILNKEMLCKS